VEVEGSASDHAAATEQGVIVGLAQRDVTVLLTTGVTRSVPVQHLRGKVNARSATSQAIDVLGNALEVGDVVKVNAGDAAGATGTIRHISKFHLFLYNFTRPANGGFFVARSRMCALAGTRVKAPGTIPASNAASAMGASAFGGGAGGGRLGGSFGAVAAGGRPGGFGGRPGGGPGGAGGFGQQHELVGRTVRVTKGPHKGKIGIVKSGTFSHVAVEMHSGLKLLSLPKEQVTAIEARVGATMPGHAFTAAGAPAGAAGGAGGTTPFPYIGGGGATPAPGYGASTGYALGGATPAYGLAGATPAYGESRQVTGAERGTAAAGAVAVGWAVAEAETEASPPRIATPWFCPWLNPSFPICCRRRRHDSSLRGGRRDPRVRHGGRDPRVRHGRPWRGHDPHVRRRRRAHAHVWRFRCVP
jgi:transcription elongation factor SPT5